MTATLKFPSRPMAQKFASNWAFYSRRGYDIGAAQKDGSSILTLYNVTDDDKQWIDLAVQKLNACPPPPNP